jgi:U4/U6 small nuclear ribonucleoprotein PRP31
MLWILQDLRRKIARMVANKCTLAARVDACHESPSGTIGRTLRDEIEKKLDKLLVRKYCPT